MINPGWRQAELNERSTTPSVVVVVVLISSDVGLVLPRLPPLHLGCDLLNSRLLSMAAGPPPPPFIGAVMKTDTCEPPFPPRLSTLAAPRMVFSFSLL